MNRTEASAEIGIDNDQVADKLQEVAKLLEAQGANPFRVRAYRSAAETLRSLDRSVAEILKSEGLAGLRKLRGIGTSLARSIEQLVHGGRLGLLDRLRGEANPERLLATVFGIGPELASRIHDQLGVETLPDLYAATIDGRLASVSGMGSKRIRGIRESLVGRFRHALPVIPRPLPPPPEHPPPIAELLDVDVEYRREAESGHLPLIAPRRFNPTQQAWLPILHTERGSRHYTALFSNTARAHELGTTHDWVIIYRDDDGGDGQWTVITSRLGSLAGRRIVRGREDECRTYYREE